MSLPMARIKWTDAMIADRIMENYRNTGKFPTNAYLQETGQNNLSCAIVRAGGFPKWSERLGIPREHSDSDTGWDGEIEVAKILREQGFTVDRPSAVKNPYDLLVNDILRVDVKTAKFAKYGPCSGWFYRIGKAPQADLIALFQMDTKEVYWMPWYRVPHTNITISKSGGIHSPFRNNLQVVQVMMNMRKNEANWVSGALLKEAA
jgi:hypothetical protein